METTRDKDAYRVVPGTGENGTPIFSVLVKRTYDLRLGQAVRADQDRPLTLVDEYYDHGDATWASVKYETDLVPFKQATDVVLVGKAYAPGGQPVLRMEVSVEVAGRRKVIQVTGDRVCFYRSGYAPKFSEPTPFTEMEIRYERAYGGKDLVSIPDLPFYYPRNPVGTGLVLSNSREAVEGLRLPNLEDPADVLKPERVVLDQTNQWNAQPLPQGFGWYPRMWYPRCSFVGSMPGFIEPGTTMREEALGLVPAGQLALARQFKLPSFDLRFNNGASPGLTLPYLRGGETVRLTNLTPDGVLAFDLPRDTPTMMLDIGRGENQLDVVLHTVCLRPDEQQLDLVWRGAHPYPGVDWLPEMKHMIAEVS